MLRRYRLNWQWGLCRTNSMNPRAASETKGAALLLSIVLGTQEAETGGLLEPMSSRADLTTQQDSTGGPSLFF